MDSTLMLQGHLATNFYPAITGKAMDEICAYFTQYWEEKKSDMWLSIKLSSLGWDEHTVEKIMDPVLLNDNSRKGRGECPQCHSDDLEYGSIDFEDDCVGYKYKCNQCGDTGIEWYETTYLETVSSKEPENEKDT